MSARKNRGTKDIPMQEEWKDKIRASQIMNKLYSCVDGKTELTAQQIKAADILLKKIIPDLGRQEIANPPGEAFKTQNLSESDKEIINRAITNLKEPK